MEVASAFALKSTRRFKEAAKSNVAEWFREFLRNNPPKKVNGTNYLAPLKAFMKYMKKALRKHRPEGSSGIQKGDWRLPCGLKSSKAWMFFEKLFAQLRIHMMPAVKDAAPKRASRKGRFQIIPAESRPPVEGVLRKKRRPTSATTFMRIGDMLVPVIDNAAFLRRPRDDKWKSLNDKIAKAPTNRRDKRGPSKPNACRM